MIPIEENLWIFDCEVLKYNWAFVFKKVITGQYVEIENDYDGIEAFLKERPLLAGFNSKHYDQWILKAVMLGLTPQEIKEISDDIIVRGKLGWQLPVFRNCGVWFDHFDLMDDTQKGLSLKAIEGHLGMNICESSVPFDIDRPLTAEELDEILRYCRHDVDATEMIYKLRKVYIENKLTLGYEKGLSTAQALSMTNAKLTAVYLDAQKQEHDDERNYVFPDDLLWEYIPDEVRSFFDQIHDRSISDEQLWEKHLDIMVGECPTKIGWGGIHGAIPHYQEEKSDNRVICNADVGSYYPHLITVGGYTSRNIPSPETYEAMLKRRMEAKKSGDKSIANALKLVANTTYGATLSEFNDLYDPLMGRSVCITGQLRLLELANHLLAEVPTLKVIQLNTDGIMCSFDWIYHDKWDMILREWENRTGFTLEVDDIYKIVQKDVNGYVEVPIYKNQLKIKGGYLVRGVVTNGYIDFDSLGLPQWKNLAGGAFNINNNAEIVSNAVINYLALGKPIEETINECNEIFAFQIIAKTWAKCGNAFHKQFGTMVEEQRVNRVYATDRWEFGTLYMLDPDTQEYRKVTGVPEHLLVDNDNHLTIDVVDRDWYIRLARKQVNDFLGIKFRRNAAITRKINKMKKGILESL